MYVLNDGREVHPDLGNYERYLRVNVTLSMARIAILHPEEFTKRR